MRKAYFAAGGWTPPTWIFSAALVYDKLLINGCDSIRRGEYPPGYENSLEAKEQFKLVSKFTRHPGLDLFEDEEIVTGSEDYIYSELLDFREERGKAPKEDSLAILMGSSPDVDYFNHPKFEKRGLTNVIPSIERLVPLDPRSIQLEQLADFRVQNEYRRFKFQKTADELLSSFGEVSTEVEAERVLRFVESEMTEQYHKLETLYRHTKIEATARTIATIGGPPALLGVVGSALNVCCLQPVAFVASAALSVVPWLIAKEKAAITVEESSWAYLWRIKQEFA